MVVLNNASAIEIGLRTASLLTGKAIKTMQRWCDEGKLASRIVDLRGKKVVLFKDVLSLTPLSLDDSNLVEQADRGDATAQNDIGILFIAAGKPQIAMEWFQEAAVQGHADAMHGLSYCYLGNHVGIEKNEQLGLHWLAAAAAQGHFIASAQMQALYGCGILPASPTTR
jgi:TPR repeat protein